MYCVSAADELASVQQPSEANLEGEAPTSSQQHKSEDQVQTDAPTDTSGRATPEDQPQGSSQQGEEESWQEANERRKVRAVDADYSVTSSKAGRNKAQVKPGKKTPGEEGALQQPGNGNMARATSTSSEASSAEKAAVLPPKPKPGAPKARKAAQPRSLDDAEDVPQVQGPQPPPGANPNAPALKQQTQPQRPAPPQTSSQTPQQQAQPPKQQPPLQRPAPPQPSGQGPSSQQPQPKSHQPSPAAIPLPANSAWAKKLDLQSVGSSSSSSSAAASAAAVPPARQPSQPPQPTPAAKPSSSSSTSTVKAIPMSERPASAGAKGKGKTKGQAKQAPVAQPSAGAYSLPGKRGSSVKEIPAKDKDSHPKASNSTVFTAPGLEKKSAAPGLQGQF